MMPRVGDRVTFQGYDQEEDGFRPTIATRDHFGPQRGVIESIEPNGVVVLSDHGMEWFIEHGHYQEEGAST
jgi:hypothetical protein